jgi:diaminopimelate decarboxylase
VTGFELREGRWCCEEVALEAIAAKVGTPFYVYSAGSIRARYQRLDRALSGAVGPGAYAIHYALKANSTLALAQVVRGLGGSADANSVGEIEIALRAGFIPTQIVFTGVGKSGEELERAVSLGLKAINAESQGELERIDAIARAQGTRARVALRVNPDVDAGSHPHISTGLKRNKFGVPIGEARAIALEAAARPGLEFIGVHVHIGSQVTSLDPLRRAGESLSGLARELLDAGLPLEHLDLGGGLGISYDGSPVPDVEPYAEVVATAARATGLPVVVEPGRWLIGPPGALVARVIDTKPAPGGRRFVVLDAGMTELMRPALYGAFHRIVPVHAAARPEVVCDVVGPVCESTDTFGVERTLPSPEVGDLLAVLDAGAYGSAMSSNYNRRALPPEVLVDGEAWRVIRRRQNVEEMLALET